MFVSFDQLWGDCDRATFVRLCSTFARLPLPYIYIDNVDVHTLCKAGMLLELLSVRSGASRFTSETIHNDLYCYWFYCNGELVFIVCFVTVPSVRVFFLYIYITYVIYFFTLFYLFMCLCCTQCTILINKYANTAMTLILRPSSSSLQKQLPIIDTIKSLGKVNDTCKNNTTTARIIFHSFLKYTGAETRRVASLKAKLAFVIFRVWANFSGNDTFKQFGRTCGRRYCYSTINVSQVTTFRLRKGNNDRLHETEGRYWAVRKRLNNMLKCNMLNNMLNL